MNLDALEAYRKSIHENYNSSVEVARQAVIACMSIEQAEEEFTLLSSALESTWRYSISSEAMRHVGKTPGTLKQVKLPPQNHVWIDLSSPPPLGYSVYPCRGDLWRQPRSISIVALWFYCPDVERLRLERAVSAEPGKWTLHLMNTAGHVSDSFFYSVQSRLWSLAARNERHAAHHESEIEQHLNTWRNRLRAALLLIQQNNYRPDALQTSKQR